MRIKLPGDEMRKFVVSDIQGNGRIYDSIMAYLDHISLQDEVELTIIGDLIGPGSDSFRILKDIRKRKEKQNNISIKHLGGDQELKLYQALLSRKQGEKINPSSDWIKCAGESLEENILYSQNPEEEYKEIKTYIGNLKIYRKLKESIYHRPIVLVHAKAPIFQNKELRIKENNFEIYEALSCRLDQLDNRFFLRGSSGMIQHNKLGDPMCFMIKGHIPVQNKDGFFIHPTEHYIDIAGSYHIPLIEIEDNKLSILVFNQQNQIQNGYLFKENKLQQMPEEDLQREQAHLQYQSISCPERMRVKVLKKSLRN